MRLEAAKLLWDARTASERISSFVTGRTYEEYVDDVLLRSAVERQFTILGEALVQLRRLDPETAANVGDIAGIIAFRNLLVHGYAAVQNDIVWGITQTRMAPLAATLSALLEQADDLP